MSRLENGLRLKGSHNNLGFLFFYTLLTDAHNFKILPSDTTFQLASLLMRMFPEKDTNRGSLNMSILRILANNRALAGSTDIPKMSQKTGFKLSIMFKARPADCVTVDDVL